MGRRLTPSHATKRKRRYRYYITPSEDLDEATPDRITIRSDAIDLEVHPSQLKAVIRHDDVNHTDLPNAVLREVNEPTDRLRIKTRLKRCGGEIRLVLLGEDDQETLPKPDPGLIRAIAKAHAWASQLISGERASITEIAKRNGTSRSRAGSILTLAFLAPDIVEAILDGRQPPAVNLELLMADTGIPPSWDEQRRLYGFS